MTTTIRRSSTAQPAQRSISCLKRKLEPFSTEEVMEMVDALTPMSPMDRPMTWRHPATCRNVSPEEFYPEKSANPPSLTTNKQYDYLGKTYCKDCPVRLECLANVMVEEYRDVNEMLYPGHGPLNPINDSHGFRGGLTPHHRRTLADVIGL